VIDHFRTQKVVIGGGGGGMLKWELNGQVWIFDLEWTSPEYSSGVVYSDQGNEFCGS